MVTQLITCLGVFFCDLNSKDIWLTPYDNVPINREIRNWLYNSMMDFMHEALTYILSTIHRKQLLLNVVYINQNCQFCSMGIQNDLRAFMQTNENAAQLRPF